MIWYLLYPFRGTTEPPVLTSDHPLRRAFYQYGTAAARHWLAFILFSVATAVLFCYPVFFLYENPTTGFSKLPYHVWTSAKLYDGDMHTPADVEIRQVWVLGSYMKALEQDVLLEALRIQNTLLDKSSVGISGHEGHEDPTVCTPDTTENALGGFHSPLMFWNCSSAAITSNPDILGVINSQAHRKSYMNLTLRPTSVFAGKSFVKDKVIAADALVITLFDRLGDDNERWDDRLALLAKDAPSRWSMYPRDSHILSSRLYEFQQIPMSFQDNALLGISYMCMCLYVLSSLGKLRAVKSKLGLMVTVIFEIAVSIIASFSICGMLQIDLARIPDAAYPFVVLVMGLENMFRLINAVLSQPPELPTIQRIATAVGEVGHLSLATAAQMLFILWMLSKVASGVAAFCTFAAIALIFDFLLHLTFFLAVLSVDVRRMELRDSLERVYTTQRRRQIATKPERQYWLDALLQGRLPFSSRIAGSATSISFILTLNMHFYQSGNAIWSLVQSVKSMFHSTSRQTSAPFAPPPINQARTPVAWLRIQDYRYAQEVLGFVKPKAHSIIARVYDPLTMVLKDADRSAMPSRPNSSLMIFWDLTQKHLYPFLLAVIFSVATVTLLMQYMLWNELPEEQPDIGPSKPSILSIATLPKAHRLDVIKLTACGKGHLISVSLDRLMSISLFDPTTHKYSLRVLSTAAMTPPLWPIVSIAIDDNGAWAALCSFSGNIALWNLRERRLSNFIHIDLEEQQPCAFSLVSVGAPDSDGMSLLIATPNGEVTEVDVVCSDMIRTFQISNEKLTSTTISRGKLGTNIIALTRSGRVRLATNHSGGWVVAALEKLDPRLTPSSKEGKVKYIVKAPLCMFAAVRLRIVDLVDMSTKLLIHTFPAILVKSHSLRILTSPRRECPQCHGPAVHSVSLAYTDFESQSFIMRTYTISDDHNDLICLAPRRPGNESKCRSPSSAKERVHIIGNPGSWEATSMESIIGIRQIPSAESGGTNSAEGSTTSGAQLSDGSPDNVKYRNQSSPTFTDGYYEGDGEWEAYTLSTTGKYHSVPLVPKNNDTQSQKLDEDDLFVASPGPISRLGSKSVCLAFGNRVKIVMVGNERFEVDTCDYQDLRSLRRRKPLTKKAQ